MKIRLGSKTKKILISLTENLLPLLFWVSVIFGFDTPYIAVLTILSAILHELGHYIMIILFKCDAGDIVGHISGFRIKNGLNSYIKDILMLSGGPLINLAVFIILLPCETEYIKSFASLNLVTALSNLLPIESHDGYGMLYKLFSFLSFEKGKTWLFALSFLLTALLVFLSLYLLGNYGGGYWLFGVFFFTLIGKINRDLKTGIFRE